MEMIAVRRGLTRRSMGGPSAADGGSLEGPANSMRARLVLRRWRADDRWAVLRGCPANALSECGMQNEGGISNAQQVGAGNRVGA